MPKRSRSGSSKRKKSKKRAKTRVDKRQDKAITRIKKLLAPEPKWRDANIGTELFSTVYGLDFTKAIRVWDGTNNDTKNNMREGQKLFFKGIKIRGTVSIPYTNVVATMDLTNRVRMVILIVPEMPYTGTTVNTVALDDVMQPSSPSIDYLYKKPAPYKYKVIYDKTFDMVNLSANNSTVLAGSNSVHGDAKISWKHNINTYIKVNKMVEYVEGTAIGQGAQPLKNVVSMFLFSDSAPGSVGHPRCQFSTRTYFLD